MRENVASGFLPVSAQPALSAVERRLAFANFLFNSRTEPAIHRKEQVRFGGTPKSTRETRAPQNSHRSTLGSDFSRTKARTNGVSVNSFNRAKPLDLIVLIQVRRE